MCLCVNGLLKPTDNVGQQAKDNWQGLKCQSSIFIERTVCYLHPQKPISNLINTELCSLNIINRPLLSNAIFTMKYFKSTWHDTNLIHLFIYTRHRIWQVPKIIQWILRLRKMNNLILTKTKWIAI